MSKKSKLIERLKSRPKDFTWGEACTLMRTCGFTRLHGSGSRVKFVHELTRKKVFIHSPHPESTMKGYAVKELLEALTEAREIDE